jgi:glycosyltransferase involved in cell wall biosynthesis
VLLSATLIVRNEAKYLGDCLESLRPFTDERVVVDTGSTDNTREIAAGHGARVHEFAWTEDFSEARNHALSLARGEWVLYLDADERVRPNTAAAVREDLDDGSYAGWQTQLHPRPGFTAHWVLRLFRNDPSIRFQGVMHETVWASMHRYLAASGRTIGYSALQIDHIGYESEQAAKHLRNRPLLEKAVAREPERVYCWNHLASVYAELGEAELAERTWLHAIDLVRGQSRASVDDSLPYTGLIQWRHKHGGDVEALLAEALERFPGNLQLYWLHARILMEQGKHAAAIEPLERLVGWGATGLFDRSLAYDERMLNVLAHESLATCYFRLRRFAESRAAYAQAAQCAPERRDLQVKQELCARLERN